jgi:hypothetical protein
LWAPSAGSRCKGRPQGSPLRCATRTVRALVGNLCDPQHRPPGHLAARRAFASAIVPLDGERMNELQDIVSDMLAIGDRHRRRAWQPVAALLLEAAERNGAVALAPPDVKLVVIPPRAALPMRAAVDLDPGRPQAAKSCELALRREHANDAEIWIPDGDLHDRLVRSQPTLGQRADKIAEREGHG